MLKRTKDSDEPKNPLFSYTSGTTHGSEQEAFIAETPPPQQLASVRLWERRWLVGLALSLMIALSLSYHIRWYECVGATAVFVMGAAFIPRTGLKIAVQPVLSKIQAVPSPEPAISALINALPDPALLLSMDGNVQISNGKCNEFFFSLKSGSHISAAIRNPKILDAVEACCAQLPRQTVFFTERVPVERHMSATVCYLSMEQPGSEPRIFICLRDLTDQLRHDQLRADFIANASHEIKTPLASLLGFIETLQGAARHDEAARDRFLAIMAKQAERMARLIDNLMSLSRVEMRAHLKPQNPIHISELVTQACDALEPMAAEANIDVIVTNQAEDAVILGDKDELTQAVLNLVHNAIKYGRTDGKITVCLDREAEKDISHIVVSVADDGPGIPAEYLPRLTERFYRVPDTPALEKGGTGLGLAIVKHVVNHHRGELRIQSKEGEGSKFTIILKEHRA